MTFDQWWVGKFGRPPLPGEQFEAARLAWEDQSETVAILRLQLRGFTQERDEAMGKSQRHEELRKQAERQSVRFQKRSGALVVLVEQLIERSQNGHRLRVDEFCASAKRILDG